VKMEAICSSEKFVTKHGTKYVDWLPNPRPQTFEIT
jgi:hypothetical protein